MAIINRTEYKSQCFVSFIENQKNLCVQRFDSINLCRPQGLSSYFNRQVSCIFAYSRCVQYWLFSNGLCFSWMKKKIISSNINKIALIAEISINRLGESRHHQQQNRCSNTTNRKPLLINYKRKRCILRRNQKKFRHTFKKRRLPNVTCSFVLHSPYSIFKRRLYMR